MSIETFTIAQQALVDAIPEPKHLWYNLNEIIVYTGDDLPTPNTEPELTVEALRNRFTTPEMLAFLALAKTDTTAELLLFKLQTRSLPIPKDDNSLLFGMGYLVQQGVLTAPRAVEILE
jgi:hypothetical protein